MTVQTNLVPKRRFKEFQNTHAWEQRELGDLMEISSASRVHKDEWTEFGVPFFRSSDVVSEFKGTENNKAFISQSLFEELSIKSGRVKKGDVLVTGGGSIGIPYLIKNDNPLYFKDADLIWLKSSETINGTFLYTFFTTSFFRNYVNSITHIGTISHYTIEQAKATPIRIPKKEEQTKIGNFFKQLDKTIALHKRKLEKTKALKSAYLSEMFPAEGEREPKRRFAGFTQAWEQRKLGEYAKYRRGSFPQPYGNKDWYDGIGAMPFVQVVDVGGDLRLVDDTKQKISKLAQPKSVFVPAGRVVVTLQGSIGRVAITQYDSYVDRTLLIFDDNQFKTNQYFWAYTIQRKFDIEKQKAPGGTIKTITKEALSAFDVYLPNYEEQDKIGNFFKQLDDTIALHQRKLEKLQNIKKAYLNEMFI
jgi:type I restriction enzyme, S subunit